MVARKERERHFLRETISFMSHERVAPYPSRNASEARGGRRCARLRRAGAGERAESSGAERGEGTGQREGAERERDSIADGTALRCGRVGSRHFRELEEKSPGSLVFVSATLSLLAIRLFFLRQRIILNANRRNVHYW